jgi:hypothetical protein
MKMRGTILTACAVLLWSGLACAQPSASGFIQELPALEPSPDVPGMTLWRKEGLSLGAYDKVYLEPIEIWLAPGSEYKGIDPDEMKTLTETMRQAIVARLEPEYPVVDSTAAGVLGLRLAITGVNLQNKKRNLLGYTPIGFVVTTAGNAMGARMALGSATVEAEFYDGATRERIAVMLDLQLGDEIAKEEGKSEDKDQIQWKTVQESLDFYAQRLRGALDRERN